LVQVKEALFLILQKSKKTPLVYQDLEESPGLVLGEDIKADRDYPPFNRSRMDGFALSTGDLKNASPSNPVTLKVKGIIPAGSDDSRELNKGEVFKIMTGAPLPRGADGVVPLEDSSWQEDRARFIYKIEAGSNITFQGEELRKGEITVRKGIPLGSGEMVLLAMAGKKKVKVYSPPRVGILVTGEEVVNIGENLAHGKIRNTNVFMLAAQTKAKGGIPSFLGLSGDRVEEIKGLIAKNLPYLDVILTTGGAGGGDYDLIEEVFSSLGANILFRQLLIKPGHFTLGAWKEDKILVGLSGSPAGAFVSFELLVGPLLKEMQGHNKEEGNFEEARLKGYIKGGFSQDRYLKGKAFVDKGTIRVEAKRGGITSFVGVNSLIYIPRGEGPFREGDRVKVILINGLSL